MSTDTIPTFTHTKRGTLAWFKATSPGNVFDALNGHRVHWRRTVDGDIFLGVEVESRRFLRRRATSVEVGAGSYRVTRDLTGVARPAAPAEIEALTDRSRGLRTPAVVVLSVGRVGAGYSLESAGEGLAGHELSAHGRIYSARVESRFKGQIRVAVAGADQREALGLADGLRQRLACRDVDLPILRCQDAAAREFTPGAQTSTTEWTHRMPTAAFTTLVAAPA